MIQGEGLYIVAKVEKQLHGEEAFGFSRKWCCTHGPLGYPAGKMSAVDIRLRESVKGDKRLPASQIFFDRTFSTQLPLNDQGLSDILEAVRWALSAANMQPWRVVKDGKADACTLAFYMVSSHIPPCVTIVINATSQRKTLQSILDNKGFGCLQAGS